MTKNTPSVLPSNLFKCSKFTHFCRYWFLDSVLVTFSSIATIAYIIQTVRIKSYTTRCWVPTRRRLRNTELEGGLESLTRFPRSCSCRRRTSSCRRRCSSSSWAFIRFKDSISSSLRLQELKMMKSECGHSNNTWHSWREIVTLSHGGGRSQSKCHVTLFCSFWKIIFRFWPWKSF